MSKDTLDGALERCIALSQSDADTARAFCNAIGLVGRTAPEVARAILAELQDQRASLKLIASENYCSLAVQMAMANWLTDKYAEGAPHARFYAGCDNVDAIEARAVALLKEIFGCEHAYVQPHSGIDANLVAFSTILAVHAETPVLADLGVMNKKGQIVTKRLGNLPREDWNRLRAAWSGQRMLAMDFSAGGHLTHGYRQNISARLFDVHSYSVDRETSLLDYDSIERQALEIRPLILLAGYSAYPRKIDFARLREIADKAGAVLMVDMAHFAGLVAGGVFGDKSSPFNPVGHAQIVTSTTHKTLRGPRGGIVLTTRDYATQVDKGCPMLLGGPLPHIMAAKAVAFEEARRPAFRDYARRIVENAQALAEQLMARGAHVLSGGTDNHLVLVDVRPFGVTGFQAEEALRSVGVTLNRNAIPYDEESPLITSGLRLGTPALTTRGLGPDEMREIANIIADVLEATEPGETKRAHSLADAVRERATGRVRDLLASFPLYPELDALLGTAGETDGLAVA